MQDRMTSKRNSRVFTDEAAHHGEKSQPQKHHATNIATTYRSRRNSRSSGRDDSAALGSEPEEEKLKDSLSAMAAAPNKEASGAVSTKMVHTKGKDITPSSVSTMLGISSLSHDGCGVRQRARFTNVSLQTFPSLQLQSAPSPTRRLPPPRDGLTISAL